MPLVSSLGTRKGPLRAMSAKGEFGKVRAEVSQLKRPGVDVSHGEVGENRRRSDWPNSVVKPRSNRS